METAIDTEFLERRGKSPRRPLLGLTLLLVEDSRYCSEAMRLLCLKSGARLRRADCLRTAYRHLATYRPSLVIVDIGLPDGSGLSLVRNLRRQGASGPVVLVTSGDDPATARERAHAAGADGFLEKPIGNVGQFQRYVAGFFPDLAQPAHPKIVQFHGNVQPDALAVVDDLRNIRDILQDAIETGAPGRIAYCAQFLHSLGETSGNRLFVDLGARLQVWLQMGTPPLARLNGVITAISAFLDTAVRI